MGFLPAFVHIEKAAGTSVIHLLREAYAGRYVDVRPLVKGELQYLQARDLTLLMRIYGRPACIGGHSIAPHLDLHSKYPAIEYFTIFRDPAHRFVSQYLYWSKSLGFDGSFEDFLGRADVRNIQTNHIIGRNDVAGAIQLISERFFLVGILEQLERFLQSLKTALSPRLDQAVFPRVNATRRDTEASAILSSYADGIAEANQLDQQLYEHVRDHLIAACEARYPAAELPASQPVRTGIDRLLTKGRRGADYAVRKLYLEPVTGIIRTANGLPYLGSYRHF